MIKFLVKVFVVVALLCVIGLVVIGFLLGPVVTKAVNAMGPKITGTKVELDGASIFPLTGSGTLTGLYVGNPEGWDSDKAFYLGEVRGSVQPLSVFGDPIVINEVFMEAPEFVYEQRLLGGSNIDALIKQIDASTGGAASSAGAANADEKSAKPLKFVVKALVMLNVKVSVGVGAAAVNIVVPQITITDLGVKEGGITLDQLVGAALRGVAANLGSATAEAAKKAGGALLDGTRGTGGAAKDVGKGAVDGVKKLFGK
jgi:hypothetical protein